MLKVQRTGQSTDKVRALLRGQSCVLVARAAAVYTHTRDRSGSLASVCSIVIAFRPRVLAVVLVDTGL